MLFDNFFWNGFFSNLVPIWLQLGPQNLPKMEPSWFPIGVQQGSAQNRQNVHGAEARARFSRILGSQVGTTICKKTIKKASETGRKLGWVWDGSRHRFWTILGASWEPRCAPKLQKCGPKAVPKTVQKNVQKNGL